MHAHTLKQRLQQREYVFRDRETRVKAYTIAGRHVGLAGVGEGNQKLTFPAWYLVRDALASPHWITMDVPAGFATPYEITFQPRSIIFVNAKIAEPDDPIGLFGPVVTVWEQATESIFEDKEPNVDLEAISTPPSPGSEWDY